MSRCANHNIMLLLLVLLPACLVVQGKKHPPNEIVLYAHESRVSPTNTLVTSAVPEGENATAGTDVFGLIRTVSNILRESPDIDSTIFGSQVGIIVIGLNASTVYISYTYFLNSNATYQGTIAVHGHIDGTSTVDRAFAVVGGTGDFLSVTGVDKSADEGAVADPAHVINVHNLTLSYPYLAQQKPQNCHSLI